LEIAQTDSLSVAKLRLGDFLKEENHRAEVVQSAARGKMTFGDAVIIYKERLTGAQHLKPGQSSTEKTPSKPFLKVGQVCQIQTFGKFR